jgi:hypothetical protein
MVVKIINLLFNTINNLIIIIYLAVNIFSYFVIRISLLNVLIFITLYLFRIYSFNIFDAFF